MATAPYPPLAETGTKSILDHDAQLWALFLRFGLGSILLFQVLRVWLDLKDFAGANAIAPTAIAEMADPSWMPRIGWFAPALARVGLDARGTIVFCFALYTILLVALIANVFPKLTTILVFVLHVVISGSIHFSLYGVDQFAGVGLFYCILAPAQAPLREGSDALWRSSVVHRLLQFHLAVAYFTSAIAKSFGPQWWTGEAVWLALGQPISRGLVDVMGAMALPGVAKAAGMSVLAIEMCYPIFMTRKSTRPVWLALVVMMHLGIAIFMDMWSFAFVMIILNVSAFGTKYLAFLLPRMPKQFLRAAVDFVALFVV